MGRIINLDLFFIEKVARDVENSYVLVKVEFIISQFAWCLALNEAPVVKYCYTLIWEFSSGCSNLMWCLSVRVLMAHLFIFCVKYSVLQFD